MHLGRRRTRSGARYDKSGDEDLLCRLGWHETGLVWTFFGLSNETFPQLLFPTFRRSSAICGGKREEGRNRTVTGAPFAKDPVFWLSEYCSRSLGSLTLPPSPVLHLPRPLKYFSVFYTKSRWFSTFWERNWVLSEPRLSTRKFSV